MLLRTRWENCFFLAYELCFFSPPRRGLLRAATLSVGLPPVAREPRVSARGKPAVNTGRLRLRLAIVTLLPVPTLLNATKGGQRFTYSDRG